MTTNPTTALDLDAVRQRFNKLESFADRDATGLRGLAYTTAVALAANASAADVPALVAENRQLRAEVEKLRAELLHVGRVLTDWRSTFTDEPAQEADRVLVDLIDGKLVPTADDGTQASEQPYLIWSNHHRAWWGPNGSGYRSNIADAGRYALADTTQWLGRGCGCCEVPEVPVLAELTVGAGDRKIRSIITAATKAAIKAGQVNKYFAGGEAAL